LKRTEREELVELRRENQRLRLEREILKKATAFFGRRASEIRFYRNGEGLLPGGADVPGAASFGRGILRLVQAAASTAHA
jgi:hypothetical protein